MQDFQIDLLSASEGFPRISIYLPTHATYPDSEADPIRFTNALRTVERQLVEAGRSKPEIDELLAEAMARGKDHVAWRDQDLGLAVFIEPGTTRWVKLSASVSDLTIVGSHYHIRPLIPFLQDRGVYHLLTVTKDSARLFRGTKDRLSGVSLKAMPDGIGSVRDSTRFSADVGYHARDRGSQVGGAATPKYSALGESPEDYETTLLEHYTRDVAKAVDAHLANSTDALVLAGLPRTLGYLKKSLKYRWTLDPGIGSDPAALSERELQDQAWAIVSRAMSSNHDAGLEKLRSAIEGERPNLLKELGQIIRAAEAGRVEAVYLSETDIVWGIYDPGHGVVRIDANASADNEDLLNLAALKTLAQRGIVRDLPADLRGMIGPLGALLRY